MVWFASPWSIRWDRVPATSHKEFLNILLNPSGLLPISEKDKEDFVLWGAITLNHIWWCRNRIIHGQTISSLDERMQDINKRFAEFKACRGVHSIPILPHQGREHRSHWGRPPDGVVKINCDAAVRSDCSFVGIVARDGEGMVLVVRTAKVSSTLPERAELEAVLLAVKVAIQEGWSRVIFEGDAQAVFDALSFVNGSKLHWSADIIFNFILNLCAGFASVSFVWIPRSCNSLAHFVCKWASRFSVSGSFTHELLPPGFQVCMSRDQLGSGIPETSE